MAGFVETDDGVSLEARWDEPEGPVAVAVLCHPHPQHGGTMTAPLMAALARHLARWGCAALRFNFRGVGGSGGTWGGGRAEMNDVAAAVAAARARHPDVPLGIAGWSFGAATALRWQAQADSTIPYVGIAPPVTRHSSPALPRPEALAPATRSFVIGDRDQFVTVEELRSYAAAVGAALHVVSGSDHFFHFRDLRVAELVAAGLGNERP